MTTRRLALILSLLLAAHAGQAVAQDASSDVQPGYAPPAPPTNAQQQPAPSALGQWINTANGWVWVPSGATAYAVGDVPYVYLYTPSYGWSWYASPWGVGPFAYGAWVGRPWPYGFHAWRSYPRYRYGYSHGYARGGWGHSHGGWGGRGFGGGHGHR